MSLLLFTETITIRGTTLNSFYTGEAVICCDLL
jgi:hypothetical protein